MNSVTKERPIIFSSPMARAIIEGRKTQTRRIVKPQPDAHLDPKTVVAAWDAGFVDVKCPYGKPKDRLWVRETCIENEPPSGWIYRADLSPAELGYDIKIRKICSGIPSVTGRPWTPSILMPRKASRITLEITDVRVQRLQDISDEDVTAEGVEPFKMTQADIDEMDPNTDEGKLARILGPGQTSLKAAFEFEWHEINGKKAPWDSNPWVWAITFRRVLNA